MTSEPVVLLCPYCNSPFKSNGINRHIAKMHKGMPQVGKDIDNSSAMAAPCQSEPCSQITAVLYPIIGDEALRANQNPLDELYAEGLAAPVDETAYTELDVPDPIVEEKPEVLVPIPASPQKVLSQIPVNSEIMLHGEVYWQHPVTFDWELAHADHLRVNVVGIETVDNVVHLMCRASGGQALWSVLQSDVLEGKYRVVTLAPSTITVLKSPPPGKRNIAEDPAVIREKARQEFLPMLNEYMEKKELLELAEMGFSAVQEKYYADIENYVLQFGEHGKDVTDYEYCELVEDGVKMIWNENLGVVFEKVSRED